MHNQSIKINSIIVIHIRNLITHRYHYYLLGRKLHLQEQSSLEIGQSKKGENNMNDIQLDTLANIVLNTILGTYLFVTL